MKHLKRGIAVFLAFVMVFGLMPGMSFKSEAAAKPTLSTSAKILVGAAKTFTINKNGYKILSVESLSTEETVADVVPYKNKIKIFAFDAGRATIKTVIRAKKGNTTKNFTIKTRVTVPEMKATLDRTSLTEGEYTQVRLSNVNSKARISYSSSNTAVATVNNNGVVIAGSTIGTATITATVELGANALSDGDTFDVQATVSVTGLANKTVSTQVELENILRSGGASKVTLSTSAGGRITIPNGTYSKVALVVSAPNATIENYGVFKSVTIADSNSNNWYERAKGNNITVTSPRAVKLNLNLGYDVSSITFAGNATGTSSVDLTAGVLGNLNVTGATSVNLSVKGSSAVSKISLSPDSVLSTSNTLGINVAGTSAIGTIEATDMGGTLSIGTTDSARVTSVNINRNNRYSGSRTYVNVTSAGNSSVSVVTVSSNYVTGTFTENGSSQIGTVRITDGADVTVAGNSSRETFIDLNSDVNNSTRVTLNTSKVRIECANGLAVTTVILNKSGQTVNALAYDSRGIRYSQAIASMVDNRPTQSIKSVTRLSLTSIQVNLAYADYNLTRNNFTVYSSTYNTVNSASYTNGGKSYILNLNSYVYDETNYTIQITGIDTNNFKNTQATANLFVGVTALSLNKTSISKTEADLGKTEQLVAKVTTNGDYTVNAIWSSSNSSVASVTSAGLVTFRSVGTAYISVSAGSKVARCTITITKAATPVDNTPAISAFVGRYESMADSSGTVYTMVVESTSVKDEGKATITYSNATTGETGTFVMTGKFADNTLTYTAWTLTDNGTSVNLENKDNPGQLIFYSANSKNRCTWQGAGRLESTIFTAK